MRLLEIIDSVIFNWKTIEFFVGYKPSKSI